MTLEWQQGAAPPATAPVEGTFAAELYDELAPVAQHDEANGYALAHYLSAIGVMYEEVESIIRDRAGRPGWAVLFDPAACPDFALPWLAQFAGVPAGPGTPPAALRAAIIARAGYDRGTPAAIKAAVAAVLTGERAVRLLERESGDAYALGVVVRPAETPDEPAALEAAMAAKPAGLILTLYVIDYSIYATLIDDYDDYADLLATGPATYAGLLA